MNANPTAPPSSEAAEVAALVSSLHTRLVTSGEWGRLVKQLRKGLEGSQWDADLQDYAREKAMEQEGNIGLRELIALVKPQARDTVPEELKDQLLNAIRAFVEKNVED